MNEIHLDSIDSTNTFAKQHSADFPQDQITCIIAEEQTAGRGRSQKKWISPRGVNLYATFYFVLPLNTRHLTALAQVMAYSLATLLIQERFQPKIKWPNDVQLHGKKVSGVLCETEFSPNRIEVFLGIGVNVNQDRESVQTIDQPATSLLLETGKYWDRAAFLKKIKKQFISDLEQFKKEGFTPFRSKIEALLAFKGEKIRCSDGKREWVGICHSLAEDGQLNLLLDNQTIHKIISSEYFLKLTD